MNGLRSMKFELNAPTSRPVALETAATAFLTASIAPCMSSSEAVETNDSLMSSRVTRVSSMRRLSASVSGTVRSWNGGKLKVSFSLTGRRSGA